MSLTGPSRAGGPPPWLVLVDLQQGFRTGPWATPGFDAAAARARELVGEFGDRVVLTRFVPPAEPVGAWAAYYEDWPFALEAPASTWSLVDGLGRREEHPVVDAPTFGKWGPDLLAATDGSLDLVLGGVSTDCCVLSTVLAAADAGAFVRVVEGACAGSDDVAHRRALDAMTLYGPQVTVV